MIGAHARSHMSRLKCFCQDGVGTLVSFDCPGELQLRKRHKLLPPFIHPILVPAAHGAARTRARTCEDAPEETR